MTLQNEEKKTKLTHPERIRRSFIIFHLTRFSLMVYAAIRTSIIGGIFTSYDRLSDAFASSLLVTKIRSAADARNLRTRKKAKHQVARAYEQSLFLTVIKRASRSLLFSYVNALGLFFFSFGFYTVVIQLLKQYTFNMGVQSPRSLVAGAVLMVVSVFMFFSKKTVAAAISDSRFLRTFLFDFLGLRASALTEPDEAPRRAINIPFLLALGFGVLAIFVEPIRILILCGMLLAMALILTSPEAGVLIVFVLLPFLPTMALVALISLIFVSYLLKLVCGRRTVKFTLVDFTVLLFMVFTFFGGIFTVDYSGLPKMLVFVCFMMGYFIVKNTVRSPALVRKCLCSVAISGFAVSLYGLYQNFFGILSTTWQDTAVFSEIRGRVVSVFANPNVLGEYLILILPITLSLMMTAKKTNERFILLLAAAADCACLVFTWSRGAWLGFIVSLVLFLCLSNKGFFTAGILCLPAVVAFFLFGTGTSVVRRLTTIGDSSSTYRFGIWKGVLRMLSDISLFGIGIGEGAFREVYPFYALSGIEAAPHSHSLYLQITVETGIFSLLAFLLFVFTFTQCSLTFAKKANLGTNRLLCLGVLCGVLAFLTQGLTDYVFYNYRLFLLFFMLAGLGIAHIFTAKNTAEESDDFYY